MLLLAEKRRPDVYKMLQSLPQNMFANDHNLGAVNAGARAAAPTKPSLRGASHTAAPQNAAMTKHVTVQ